MCICDLLFLNNQKNLKKQLQLFDYKWSLQALTYNSLNWKRKEQTIMLIELPTFIEQKTNAKTYI